MPAKNTNRSAMTSGMLLMPDWFWECAVVRAADRFDIVESDGALKIRPCPHTRETYRANGPNHPGDAEWGAASYCGLTKWVCAGCATATIVATEDDFPAGWFEVARKDAVGDTEAFEVLCSPRCAVRWSNQGGTLRPVRTPGFSAPSD